MFKKSERKLIKLRLGICGPSGSGKTWSALLLATGIGGKIALIDTEKRGHLYSDYFEYDISELNAPYSTERYIERIKEAEKLKYNVLIIDSLSHAWVGDGGVLSIVENSTPTGKSTFSNGWKNATPKQNALIDAIITSNIHIIITLRSKTEYVIENKVPHKVGTAPVQRDGIEYECTMFMDMNSDNFAKITKDNTRLFGQQTIKPTVEMGESIKSWLMEGKSIEDLYSEELEEIRERLKGSTDIDHLSHNLKVAVNNFPNLRDVIIPIASSLKSKFINEDINQ